jgi:transcription elongation factor Elf1
MINYEVTNKEGNKTNHIILEENDKCYVCGCDRSSMCFSWNMFHGQATSSCCGASYQLKDYYIENPTDTEKEYLDLLKKSGNIDLSIDEKYLDAVKKIYDTGEYDNINDKGFVDKVMEIVK